MEKPATTDMAEAAETLRGFLGSDQSSYPVQIESRFPRIFQQIVALWGKPELDTYLNDLMVTDRHDRQGFSDDVARELFRLSVAHAALGLSNTHSGTGWAGIQDADLFRKSIKKEG
nr:hypothetical protein [Dechloromonas sp.]